MAAVGFALLAAVSFGGMALAIRYGLQRATDASAGALVQNLVALGVCGGVALGRSQWHGSIVPFLLTGLIAPGLSQLLMNRGIRAAGPARVSIVINTSPLLSVAIAIVFLGEPFRAGLALGAVLIVLGGVALVRERARPGHVRLVGLVLAVAVAVCFAVRDNLVRHFALDTTVEPELAAVVMLVAGSALSLVAVVAERPRDAVRRIGAATLPFIPAGLLLGLAYVGAYEALFRGRVTVVAPLMGTASFWAVFFSVLAFRRVELVGRHVALGAALVVAGAALIGAFR